MQVEDLYQRQGYDFPEEVIYLIFSHIDYPRLIEILTNDKTLYIKYVTKPFWYFYLSTFGISANKIDRCCPLPILAERVWKINRKNPSIIAKIDYFYLPDLPLTCHHSKEFWKEYLERVYYIHKDYLKDSKLVDYRENAVFLAKMTDLCFKSKSLPFNFSNNFLITDSTIKDTNEYIDDCVNYHNIDDVDDLENLEEYTDEGLSQISHPIERALYEEMLEAKRRPKEEQIRIREENRKMVNQAAAGSIYDKIIFYMYDCMGIPRNTIAGYFTGCHYRVNLKIDNDKAIDAIKNIHELTPEERVKRLSNIPNEPNDIIEDNPLLYKFLKRTIHSSPAIYLCPIGSIKINYRSIPGILLTSDEFDYDNIPCEHEMGIDDYINLYSEAISKRLYSDMELEKLFDE